jgi:transketolase
MATRDASGKVLNAVAQRVPWLLGGAADLSPSTKTNLTFEGAGSFEAPGPSATIAAATSISAFANTPWSPRSTA